MNWHVGLFVLSVVIVSFSQVLLKQSADRRHAGLLCEYLNWRVLAAYALFFGTTLMVIVAFRGVDLKNGPIIQSLGYIFVLVLERLFQHKPITRDKVLGIALIVAGIVIFNLR
ncbi:MAG TPA: multidrug ABC transporter [candidate division WOR-3 bacterium]|uniref:Multidrug ABC transporter n=1 Tax=candidate division WOR-3 bacterium TaxID=2052148 RepID=A0A7V0T7G4_UNCW3|nr:multidrug ABC transporter [candidate division WOR-3 bacterium]